MSSIFCSHGEYLHPWDCDICEAAFDASVGDIVNDPRFPIPEAEVPSLLQIFRWED